MRSLKAETLKGNISILKNNGEEYFNKVITKIDIDNIHWIKNQGYYSAEIDDFKETNRYFIWIEGNKVTIQCDENGAFLKKYQKIRLRESMTRMSLRLWKQYRLGVPLG